MSPAPDSSSDRLLVDRCIALVPAAWVDLLAAYEKPLQRFVRKRLGSHARNGDAVDEILQQEWCILFRHECAVLRRFESERGPLRSLLMGIARKLVQRYWDRHEKCKERERPLPEAWVGKLKEHDADFEAQLDGFADKLSPRQPDVLEVLRARRKAEDLGISCDYLERVAKQIFMKWLNFRNDQ